MLKRGIKNYFLCLKHIFTPLGTMFLGMMLGFSILIPGVFHSISLLGEEIGKLSQQVHLDFSELFDQFWSMILDLNWDNPEEAVHLLFSSEWLNEAMTKILQTILGTDFDTFKLEIIGIVNDFTNQLVLYCIAFIMWWILGFIAGYILVRVLIRHTIAKRGLIKWILFTLLNSILSVVFIVLCTFLATLWKPSVFISNFLVLFLVGLFSLSESYYINKRKKIEARKIVNLQNIGIYLLTNFLIFLIAVGLTILVSLISSILGIFIGLSLLVISFHVIRMNAESYVIEMVHLKEDKEMA